METREKNRLIAEFLGFKIISEDDFFDGKYNPNEKETLHILEAQKYDSDYNWLFGVVEYINQIDNQRFSVLINSMDCKVFDNEKNKIVSDSFGRFTPEQLKESIYTAIVDFVKWYNKQNLNQ